MRFDGCWSPLGAGIDDPALRASYAYCRQMTLAREGALFGAGAGCVPSERRPHLWAWVQAVVHPDDLLDTDGPTAVRRADFDAWAGLVRDAVARGETPDPVARAWLHTMRSCGIDPAGYLAWLAALRADLTTTGYATYADLERYVADVAVPFTDWLLRVLDLPADRLREHCALLARAQQLTNFIRDTGDDARRLGRVYLPGEDLDRFGVTPADLCRSRATPAVRALIHFETERAHPLWTECRAALPALPFRIQVVWTMGITYYEEILRAIARHDYDVLAATRRGPTPVWPAATRQA
ncbi:phytoene/squalene synthase family protein [Streptomyces sp. NBC_01803]|uniref:phytoene/squalene synthase family protein n=1 Tax=Streptomyces sp. NBC_01803 TaxID=2975946 RepID=UPI002DDB4305|nr:phytoene/squalene synthase family protein [Streptomyces sp. NBC_01803]WSA46117.1 squalene/phytoene synthase family protein [Streptomyces sp. NBC_01803]